MKKCIYFVLLISLVIACNKKNKIDTKIDDKFYYIEDFRKPGMDDYQTIVAAQDSLPENSKIMFSAKTYVFSHTPIIQKSLFFYGPAILKREDQITYTLKEPADESSTKLILNNTEGLISADRILVGLNETNAGTTVTNVAIEVRGDTVILNTPLGKTVDNRGVYPAGTKLFKSINFFWVVSATKYPDISCSFNNLTFDGNRDNNKGSYSWLLNAAVVAVSKGTTKYRDCKFMNSPGETIVGHNADIRNCTFYNLNGSGFHTSADKQNCPENEIHSYLAGNTFENTNQINTTIGGHSEGAITHSNSGGYYTATGNTFINVGESVLGALYPSNSINDWGTSNILFTGNKIDGADRMVYLIDTSAGIIHDVKIEKNTISNLNGHDFSKELKIWPGIVLKNKSGK